MLSLFKLLKSIVNLLMKKRKLRTEDVNVPSGIEVLQQEELVLKSYIKNQEDKFSEDQKEIMLCGIRVGVNIQKIANRYLTIAEMQNNLQVLIIEKYLGEDYLKNLAKEGKYLSDLDVQNDLLSKLNDEIACSTICQIDECKYDELRGKLNSIGINVDLFDLDTRAEMEAKYLRLLKEYISRNVILEIRDLTNISSIQYVRDYTYSVHYTDGRVVKYLREVVDGRSYYFKSGMFILVGI